MRVIWIVLAGLLCSCANHPVDCALGFHHADCLPGTPGYDDPDKFADTDDKACRSYGLSPGTSEYADCRIKLRANTKPVCSNSSDQAPSSAAAKQGTREQLNEARCFWRFPARNRQNQL
jgi:hypothetical protein